MSFIFNVYAFWEFIVIILNKIVLKIAFNGNYILDWKRLLK